MLKKQGNVGRVALWLVLVSLSLVTAAVTTGQVMQNGGSAGVVRIASVATAMVILLSMVWLLLRRLSAPAWMLHSVFGCCVGFCATYLGYFSESSATAPAGISALTRVMSFGAIFALGDYVSSRSKANP